MTISSEEARVVHTANGVATFFSYAPIDGATASNIKVWLFDPATAVLTPQTLTTHYTFGGGGITFNAPPANGLRVIIRREVSFTQPDIYTTNTPFPAKVTENRLDQIVMGMQELKDDVLNRSIRLPLGDAGFSSSTLPAVEGRRGKLLGFDATTGDPIVYSLPGTTSTMTPWGEGLIAQANSAAGRAYMGAGAIGDILFQAATAASARSTLGASAVGDALFTAASAAAARSTLGAGAIGDALFTAATAASALSAIGAAASGAITGSGLTVSTTSRLLGRYSAGGGPVEEIVIGTGLNLSGNTISASPAALTVSSGAILGRHSPGPGPVEELNPTGYFSLTGGSLKPTTAEAEFKINRYDTSTEGGRLVLRRAADNADDGYFQIAGPGAATRLRYVRVNPAPLELFSIDNYNGVVTCPQVILNDPATQDNHAARFSQARHQSSVFIPLGGSASDITGIPSDATEIRIDIRQAYTNTTFGMVVQMGPGTAPLGSGYFSFTGLIRSPVATYHSNDSIVISPSSNLITYAFLTLTRNRVNGTWAGTGAGYVDTKGVTCMHFVFNNNTQINVVRVAIAGTSGTFQGGFMAVSWRV